MEVLLEEEYEFLSLYLHGSWIFRKPRCKHRGLLDEESVDGGEGSDLLHLVRVGQLLGQWYFSMESALMIQAHLIYIVMASGIRSSNPFPDFFP